MTDCIFKQLDDIFICANCGFKTKIKNLHINCTSTSRIQKSEPNMLKKGINFGNAALKHVKSGMKHCTDEQKQDRFEICRSNECGLFKVHGEGGICSHDDCGCYIRSNGKFMDKLSWAESKCPAGQWGSIEQKTPE
jgi:hypothetical protein